MGLKELTLEELTLGYTKADNHTYTCIFCGKMFEEGLVYQSRGKMVTAKRAMEEHIFDKHGGVFYGLVHLDKQVNGLSDSQREIVEGMYLGADNKEICEAMGISQTTVRTHKFNIQKMKREAKIFLAALEQIENQELVSLRKHLENDMAEQTESITEGDIIGKSLHPFFTQFNLK